MQNMAQSRRDDLECLFYTLILLAAGKLPWFDPDEKETKSFEKIQEMKEQPGIMEDFLKEHPPQYSLMYKYIINLDYTEDPKYELLTDFLLHTTQRKDDVGLN